MNPAPASVNNSVILWQICDGKRGHLSQTHGLIEALRRRVALRVYQVDAPPLRQALASCVSGTLSWAGDLPAPQVAVGAGHATHLPLLAVRRSYQARAVVLMRPSLPVSWFDYCLAPAHDNPPRRDNVITTTGALNPMRAGQEQDPEHGLILIGGRSRHYGMDTEALLAYIRLLLARTAPRRWTLSNSPRTPAPLTRALPALATDAVEVVPWQRCPPGWMAANLGRARDVWVTEDSVSMICEALTAGCRVGLLPLPGKSAGRLQRAIKQLLEQGFVHMYDESDADAELPVPPRRLDEANRCAGLLLEKGLLQSITGTLSIPY